MDVVTVFGASGFVGRYVVAELARSGARIRAASRRPGRAGFLRPMGGVGQIAPVAANLRDAASVEAAVAGADAVVNLVGILAERGRQRFEAVHVEGARRVAAAARGAGARLLVHVSALGADPAAGSRYAASKGAVEAAVLEAFPGAFVLRPGLVAGPEDAFLNRFAALARFLPALPLIGGGATRFQPVCVGDVARAVAAVAEGRGGAGGVFELCGPQVFTLRELLEAVLAGTGRRRLLVPVPFAVAACQAALLERLPGAPLTRDQVRLLRRDNVASGDRPGLADLGVEATALGAALPSWLRRHRRAAAEPRRQA